METWSRFIQTTLAALGLTLILSSLPPRAAPGSPPPNGRGGSNEALALALPPGAALIGTVVVEGGRSFALLNYANSTWRLEEGEELDEGVRLKQVRADRIILESGGSTREICFDSGTSGGVVAAAPAERPPPQEVVPGGARNDGNVLDWVVPRRREAVEKSLIMKERRMRLGRGIQVPEDAPHE